LRSEKPEMMAYLAVIRNTKLLRAKQLDLDQMALASASQHSESIDS
jgi:hypothetical protein